MASSRKLHIDASLLRSLQQRERERMGLLTGSRETCTVLDALPNLDPSTQPAAVPLEKWVSATVEESAKLLPGGVAVLGVYLLKEWGEFERSKSLLASIFKSVLEASLRTTLATKDTAEVSVFVLCIDPKAGRATAKGGFVTASQVFDKGISAALLQSLSSVDLKSVDLSKAVYSIETTVPLSLSLQKLSPDATDDKAVFAQCEAVRQRLVGQVDKLQFSTSEDDVALFAQGSDAKRALSHCITVPTEPASSSPASCSSIHLYHVSSVFASPAAAAEDSAGLAGCFTSITVLQGSISTETALKILRKSIVENFLRRADRLLGDMLDEVMEECAALAPEAAVEGSLGPATSLEGSVVHSFLRLASMEAKAGRRESILRGTLPSLHVYEEDGRLPLLLSRLPGEEEEEMKEAIEVFGGGKSESGSLSAKETYEARAVERQVMETQPSIESTPSPSISQTKTVDKTPVKSAVATKPSPKSVERERGSRQSETTKCSNTVLLGIAAVGVGALAIVARLLTA